MFESNFQCYDVVNHPVQSTLCFISFNIFISMMLVTHVPLATAECVRHSAASLHFTWHLGAIWRPGSTTGEAEYQLFANANANGL